MTQGHPPMGMPGGGWSIPNGIYTLPRYTARQRSIVWKAGAAAEAAACLLELLGRASRYITRVRLAPGQGVICNNVLHARSAFRDHDGTGGERLLWRARYRERVAGDASAADWPVTGAASC